MQSLCLSIKYERSLKQSKQVCGGWAVRVWTYSKWKHCTVWKINLYGLDLLAHSFSFAFAFNYVTYLVMLQTWKRNVYFQSTGPSDKCNVDSTKPNKLSLGSIQNVKMTRFLAPTGNQLPTVQRTSDNFDPCKLKTAQITQYYTAMHVSLKRFQHASYIIFACMKKCPLLKFLSS